ncbi:DUF551 domain-containing protein [Cronobacter sakazakii]
MNTISNERLEKLAEYDCADRCEVMSMAAELLALRKEREKVEPVAQPVKVPDVSAAKYYTQEGSFMAFDYKRDLNSAIRAAGHPVGADSPDVSRAAMIESAMQPCDKCGMTGIHACMGRMETDTSGRQLESLAGKAVGGSEGFECTPVADLYELLTKCGECYGYTTSAKVAADWIKEGYSAREYVKLDRLQEAMTQCSPGESAGWIPCSERMPPEKTGVLVATEFDGPGDWRMKWGTRVPGHPDEKNGWLIPGASWAPSHWQPLPGPPCK